MARVRKPFCGDILVEHEPTGLRGRACVKLTFEALKDLTFRFSLEDAESIADEIIKCVRRAEENTEVKF